MTDLPIFYQISTELSCLTSFSEAYYSLQYNSYSNFVERQHPGPFKTMYIIPFFLQISMLVSVLKEL